MAKKSDTLTNLLRRHAENQVTIRALQIRLSAARADDDVVNGRITEEIDLLARTQIILS